MEKVKTTLRQFVRDWSAEGAQERAQCYGPILEELKQRFPNATEDISVLCPGAGLGRLCFEIAALGFSSEGNEFSYFMLIASNFILNKTLQVNQFTIYPYLHQNSNVMSTVDQLRAVSLPDVFPSSLLSENPNFSMCAGDFLETYKNQKDTARNIIEYVEMIFNLLKPGGVWINLGPLLYHYEGMAGEFSVALSYQELKSVILQLGFVYESERMQNCVYTSNRLSMMQVLYNCVFFVATKPQSMGENSDEFT